LVHPDCGRIRYGNGDTGAVAKTPLAVVARLDLPIIRFGAFNPHQTLFPTSLGITYGLPIKTVFLHPDLTYTTSVQ
jgi:hypothetical protein